MRVELVGVYPELARTCACAMRSCYSTWPAHRLFLDRDAFPETEVVRMLNKAVELGHLDVLEHGFATWLVEESPASVLDLLLRHRFFYVSRAGEGKWVITGTVRSLMEAKPKAGGSRLLEALVSSLDELAWWLGKGRGLKPMRQEPQEGYPGGCEVWLISYTDFKGLRERLEERGARVGTGDLLWHGGFTFSVSGVSRAFTHQLVRHRVAVYSQQSQRFVRVAKGAWYGLPPTLPDELRDEYCSFMEEVASFYHKLLGRGARKEDARFVLPNSTLTHITMTAPAWEYLKLYSLRLDPAAQWEIRGVCWAMLALSMTVEPSLFERLEEPAWGVSEARRQFKELRDRLPEYVDGFERARRGDVVVVELPEGLAPNVRRAAVVKH